MKVKIFGFLKKIGLGIVKVVKALFTGNVLDNLTKVISTTSGAALTWLGIKKFFKKNKVKSEPVNAMEAVSENKEDVQDQVIDMINRDQEVDQEVRYNKYAKELMRDPAVRKAMKNYREDHPHTKGGKESPKREALYIPYVRRDGKPYPVFYHDITPEFPIEKCEKLYRILKGKGLLTGPWNENPMRVKIRNYEREFGPVF